MRARTIALTVAVCCIGVTLCLADNTSMGTWKLNDAKSQVAAGSPKNSTVVYEAAGDNVKVTTDGVDASGKPTHTEWTGKFDGKEYPVTGDSSADTRAYKQVNSHTLHLTGKKGDKVTMTGRIVIAPDGKSRTVTLTRMDSSGKKSTVTEVYDKQ